MKKKLRDARIFRNMTQQALSDATGISIRLIQKYEKGDRTPKEENLEKLADALDISPKALSTPALITYDDVMFALFELEERHGEIIFEEINAKTAIYFDNTTLNERITKWNIAKKNRSKEELKEWKLTYPRKEIKTMRNGKLVPLDDK